MNRVLVSQSEDNKRTEYLIVNGEILNDDDSVVKYGRIISRTDDWKELYNDNFLEIRENKNQLLIKSFYIDKDSVGRVLYYLYLIDDEDDFDVILNYLEKDSRLIDRTFDRKKTEELLEHLKKHREIKKKMARYLLITLGIGFLAYLILKR